MLARFPILAFAFAAVFIGFACHAAGTEERAAAAPAAAAASNGYTLVFLKTGPESGRLSAEDNQHAFQGHFANMERMANERQLLVAGPFGETRHDPNLRGVFLFDTPDPEQARLWGASDPTTAAGVFLQEALALRTDAPLEPVLDAALARVAQVRAEGREPEPGESARPYVLLTADHGDLARRELAPLRNPEGGVYLLGELSDGRVWAVLDASRVAEAQERFGPQLEAMGAVTLDDWYATEELARNAFP